MIQRLQSDVIAGIRSGVALACLAQCVEELVFNCIDAGSSSIAVGVDISTVSVEVSDNGTGLRQSELRVAGQRYFTSKCHKLDDLENVACYGFRGEALASLGKICEKLEVVSKHRSSNRTYCKLVRRGMDMGVFESTCPRPRHGTTIKACGIFYTLPVRQKLVSERVDLEQIRKRVLAIALMNSCVSFLVRNEENGCMILQTYSCASALSVISQVSGCSKSKAFKPVSITKGVYTLTGYVSVEGYANRSFQYFYVNRRLVLKTKFHNIANNILARMMSGLMAADSELGVQDESLCSTTNLDRYAGFVINLDCPYKSYDITFDPDKTFVEFENWEEPISCLKEGLEGFLNREGDFNKDVFEMECCLGPDTQESNCSGEMIECDTDVADSEASFQNVMRKSDIRASDLKRCLYSSTAKRKQKITASDDTAAMPSRSDVRLQHMRSSGSESDFTTSETNSDDKVSAEEFSLTCSVENHRSSRKDALLVSGKETIDSKKSTASSSKLFSNLTEVSNSTKCVVDKTSILAKLQKYLYNTDESSAPNMGSVNSPCMRSEGSAEMREVQSRANLLPSNYEQSLKKTEHNFKVEGKTMKSRDGKRGWSDGSDEFSGTESRSIASNANICGEPTTLTHLQPFTMEQESVKSFGKRKCFKPGRRGPPTRKHDLSSVGTIIVPAESDDSGRSTDVLTSETKKWESISKFTRNEDGTSFLHCTERAGSVTGANDLVGLESSYASDDYPSSCTIPNNIVNSAFTDHRQTPLTDHGMVANLSQPPIKDCEGLPYLNMLQESKRYNFTCPIPAGLPAPSTDHKIPSPRVINESPLKNSEWLLQYSPLNQQPVYVNLRTGNTSIKDPLWKPLLEPASPRLEKQTNANQPRRFHPFAAHLSHNFTPWLPKSVSPKPIQCGSSSDTEEKCSDVARMLEKWVNPVFEGNADPVTDASFTDNSKTSMKRHSSAQPFRFTKDCFKKMKVISQVDNKFILCYYQGDENEGSLLVVVDQHAAHERVRLENFIKDLYISSYAVPKNKLVMKSSPLSSQCKLAMFEHDIQLMRTLREQLQQVGITFEDPQPSSSGSQTSVNIKTVPSVFLGHKYSDNGETLRMEIKKCVKDLIQEQIEVLISTKAAPTFAVPKAITRVLNSRACHGAIRFGDPLSTEECISLMSSLSKCDLPFQCAHGRPSMIPLVNTKLAENAEISKKETCLPKIWRIKERRKEKCE